MTNPFDERIKNLSYLEKIEILEILAGIRNPEEVKSPDLARLMMYCLMFNIKTRTIHPGLQLIDPLDVQENPLDNEMWSLSLKEVSEIYHLMLNIPEKASEKVEFLATYCKIYFDETGTFHPRLKVFRDLS